MMKRYKLQVLYTVRKKVTAYVDAPNGDMALIHALDPARLDFDEAGMKDFFEDAVEKSVPASTPELVLEDPTV